MEREMKKRTRDYIFLYSFYALYFVSLGITSFNSKYFGEIGMSNAQIGILTSVPGIVGIFFQPIWGVFSDRVKYKRTVLFIATLVGGSVYFFTGFTESFWPILIGMTAITIFFLPVTPVSSSISLEYTEKFGGSFGPIRMSGTIGYQIGALVIGFILVGSLRGIFKIIGIMVILCCIVALLLPPVEGHQHGRKKVSYLSLLNDKRMLLLLSMTFIGTTTSMFYMSFFTKRLGDLGFDNGITGIITVISVFLEIPFLFFSQRLYKKLTMWHWLLIGFGLNAVRWVALGFANTVPVIILANLPAVSIMACFEFFPAIYINDHTMPELKGSAQSLLSLVTFGITKLTGSLLGGFICSAIGIPATFVGNGILLAVMFLVFLVPCKKMIALDRTGQKS